MNRQDLFNTWKGHKEKVEVSRGFSERVMTHVAGREVARRASVTTSTSRLKQMAARPWARAAMVILGVPIGLVRIVMTLDLILRA